MNANGNATTVADGVAGAGRAPAGDQVPLGEQDLQADEVAANGLTLEEAQRRVDRWIREVGVRYFSELTNLAQLVEEVGEVARIVSRTYGDQSYKPSDDNVHLADELADVLFVLICLANQTGVNLTAALKRNLENKTQRDRTRHQGNAKLRGGTPACP
jgi:NTP pyrophosphatase (non-canonical NTP hydrolase)